MGNTIEELIKATPDDPRHTHLYISWSAMRSYEECNGKRRLQMQGKKSEVTDGRLFLPGTIADRAMRHYLELDDPQMGTLADLAEQYFLEHTGPDAEYTIRWRGDARTDKDEVRNRVRAALMRLEPWLHENVLPYPYQPEATGAAFVGVPGLDGEPHRVQIHLAIDILVRPETFQIYDLKVTKDESYVRGHTLGQLTFYRIALAAHLGIPIREITKTAFVTPLLKEIEHEAVTTEDEVREMIGRITRYAQGLWTGQFAVKRETDWECTRCDVRQACPKFQVAVDSGGRISLLETASRRRGLGST